MSKSPILNGRGIGNSGTLNLLRSTVSGNTSTGAGGGILNNGIGTLTITESTISINQATNGGWNLKWGNLDNCQQHHIGEIQLLETEAESSMIQAP